MDIVQIIIYNLYVYLILKKVKKLFLRIVIKKFSKVLFFC